MNPIMEKSLQWYNYLNHKKKADIEANRECQLWSDPTELNHLDFTPTPEIPKIKFKKVALPQWVKNKLKGTLGQLKP